MVKVINWIPLIDIHSVLFTNVETSNNYGVKVSVCMCMWVCTYVRMYVIVLSGIWEYRDETPLYFPQITIIFYQIIPIALGRTKEIGCATGTTLVVSFCTVEVFAIRDCSKFCQIGKSQIVLLFICSTSHIHSDM